MEGPLLRRLRGEWVEVRVDGDVGGFFWASGAESSLK